MGRKQLRIKHKKPLIVICSEGGNNTSEKNYFRNFRTRDLRIQFSSGNSTDPQGMLDDLLKYIKNEDIASEEQYQVFLVLDTDLNQNRIKNIESIIPKCIENNISIISSSPTFEIWYLMHYRAKNLKFKTSKEVKNEIQKIIPNYLESMNVYPMIKILTHNAYCIAKTIYQKAQNNNENILITNPHTNVYQIIDTINNYTDSDN